MIYRVGQTVLRAAVEDPWLVVVVILFEIAFVLLGIAIGRRW